MATRQYSPNEDRNILGITKSYFSHFVRPSRSSLQDENDGDTFRENTRGGNAHPTLRNKAHERTATTPVAGWIPYTFRHDFMCVLSFATFGLAIVTFLLWGRSSTNYGLGPDNGSSALLFGWRYSPTAIAVLWIQLTAMVFDDVKRTEPYARLARPEGAKASRSILETPSPWWVTLYRGFAKKKYGRRSWILICASSINIVGFLAISPLSSAFLYSEAMVIPRTTDFVRYSPVSNTTLPIDVDQTTHFRTIANLLQNVSTSPWISDNYTVLPFWPTSLDIEASHSLPTSSQQTWKAETTLFKSELSCAEMKSIAESVSSENVSVIWSSADGCKYGLSAMQDWFASGGSSWSNTSTFLYRDESLLMNEKLSTSNHTAECNGREIIIATEPWASATNPGRYVAQLCSTRYYMASVSVTVALAGDEPEISFDEADFLQNRVTIPDTLINTILFQDMTLSSKWNTYMISSSSMTGGASVILGALYDYNMTNLVNDPDLVLSAAKAKQRYFGEVIQSALSQDNAAQLVPMQAQIRAVESRVVVQAGPAIAMGILFGLCFLLLLVVWWTSRLNHRPLNLTKDPATTAGVVYLVTQNSRAISGFQSFRQPSSNDLQERLGGEWFYTDSQGLSRIHPDQARNEEITQSKNGTPGFLRLPALIGMVVVLMAVVVGVSVLYHYAESSDLYQKAFVYQFSVSFLDAGMSSIAPFSMIPTIIAVLIGLWWSTIDENFRRLQPYLSMAQDDPPYRQGLDLSYQTSYWFCAATKAAFNKHWLLFLVTLGSTLSPVYTTAMSALFDRGTGVIVKPITLNSSLEIREIPFIFETQQSTYPGASMNYPTVVLDTLYQNLSSYYMYTALVQLALNSSEPAWSKDGWSFVPLDVSSTSGIESLAKLGASQADILGPASQSNFTFNTPAIRGRIECSAPPMQVLANLSSWTTATDLSNHTIWNKSTIPEGVYGGYQLGNTYKSRQYPSSITPLLPGQNWTECPGCTTAFVNPAMLICCGNGSSDSRKGSVAIGYWSPNDAFDYYSPTSWQRNFTAKWVYGEAIAGIRVNKNLMSSDADAGPLFPSPPSMSLINCEPIIETAEARVTVDPSSGEVQSFNITDLPKAAAGAFTDNFVAHNGSITDLRAGYSKFNVTISYGHIFLSTLLTAADLQRISGVSHTTGYTVENLDDNTFNIRDEMQGLNMDFMTYAMYSMAHKDPKALLNPDTFVKLAQKTFTTFFQHFVGSNISMYTGGWAYQTINASLPADLAPAVESINGYMTGTKATAYQDTIQPISHTNRTATAQVSQRVQLLQMNPLAVWLSIGIMAWLMLTTVLVAILQKRFFGPLVRNIECAGDVLVLIAGSTDLLHVVREIQAGRLTTEEYERLRTRLGWFLDGDGALRWGVEMVEAFGDGPGVEWVDQPCFSKGTDTWGPFDEDGRL